MGFNSAFKPLIAQLNPICHLLALLGAHHIIHVSRIRVKGLIIPKGGFVRTSPINILHTFTWDFPFCVKDMNK
jgi:hypothetical protein